MDIECALANRVFQRICPRHARDWANIGSCGSREGPLAAVVRLGLATETRVLSALGDELNVSLLTGYKRQQLRWAPSQHGADGSIAARRLGSGLFFHEKDPQKAPTLVVCLRHPRIGRLAKLLAEQAHLQERVLLSRNSDFDLLLMRVARGPLMKRACRRLERLSPRWVCRTITGRSLFLLCAQTFVVLGMAGIVIGVDFQSICVNAAVLMAWAAVHFKVALETINVRQACQQKTVVPNSVGLPIYSIFVPLHREAACVPQLMRHLHEIDWPRHLLDIKFIVEADDLATIKTVLAFEGLQGVELVRVPHRLPKTKPKALNFALPLAEGELLVVFDAEDKPHPGQLRAAHAAFAAGPANLACVQAPLQITNGRTSWLTALFAIEYAVHFRCILPALMQLELPVPLGGSSNHFRIKALRNCGAWDPYNVAEDADIGLRLHQLGWRAGWIGKATGEQAPTDIRAWLAQRSRWVKGWAQSWIVHTRQPVRTIGIAGWRSWIAFQLIFLGGLAGMLAYPVSLALPAYFAMILVYDAALLGSMHALMLTLAFGTFAVAHVAGAVNIWRMSPTRSSMEISWLICLMPLYWLLGSIAAWRGIVELITAPHHWSKTDHVPDDA